MGCPGQLRLPHAELALRWSLSDRELLALDPLPAALGLHCLTESLKSPVPSAQLLAVRKVLNLLKYLKVETKDELQPLRHAGAPSMSLPEMQGP